MKKLIAALIAAASLASAGLIYPTTMQITKIDGDLVTMETATGFAYEMLGAEDYEAGDLISVLMFNNGTKYITDDVILSVQYSGWKF